MPVGNLEVTALENEGIPGLSSVLAGTHVRQMRLPSLSSRDPLHGITLEALLTQLVEEMGWSELGRQVPIRCFLFDPSIKSSLTFLRKTPWARAKVEEIYVRWKATS